MRPGCPASSFHWSKHGIQCSASTENSGQERTVLIQFGWVGFDVSSDEQINSLLILFPPGLKTVPTMPFLINGGIGLCRNFGASLFLRSLSYESNCQAVKSRYATPDTWYCMCFVVAPQVQGRGIGSQLIRPVLNVMKSNHVSLYLKTNKAVNVDIYKHLGFETVGVSKIPKTDIEQYSMLKGK